MNKIIKSLLIITLIAGVSSCTLIRKFNKMKETNVQIETTEGIIVVKLYNETPLHRDNFLKLVNEKFYDGTLFHRVIADFMIQGGDPNSKNAPSDRSLGSGDVGYTIPAEFKTPALYHKKGALAAARQGDQVNPQKASSGCQFYIVEGKTFTDAELDNMQRGRMMRAGGAANDSAMMFSPQAREVYKTIGGTPHLDGNYTVFGEVVKGMDVVEKISAAKTNRQDRPLIDVKVLKMKVLR